MSDTPYGGDLEIVNKQIAAAIELNKSSSRLFDAIMGTTEIALAEAAAALDNKGNKNARD